MVAGLLYGSGLRLMEALRLRVHDLDFNRQELTVRNGKGGNDRCTMLPKRLSKKLRDHMPQQSRAGSGCFPSIDAGKIQLQNNRVAIISIRA